MKPLKNKIIWTLILGLCLLQFSFALLMNSTGHEKTCAFNEHCLLVTISNETAALLPLL